MTTPSQRTRRAPKRYLRRGWLNRKAGLAAFEASIEAVDHYVSGQFTITDCNRQIALDFSVWFNTEDYDALDDRLAKIDTLTDELFKFRDKLIVAAEWVEEERERAAAAKVAKEAAKAAQEAQSKMLGVLGR